MPATTLDHIALTARSDASRIPTSKTVGLTVGIVFGLLFFSMIWVNICILQIPPKKYFITSINPLVLIFMWPYHLYTFILWIRSKISKKAANRNQDEENCHESSNLHPRRGPCHENAYEPSRSTQTAQNTIPGDDLYNLNIPNQINMKSFKFQLNGQDYITSGEVKDSAHNVAVALPHPLRSGESPLSSPPEGFTPSSRFRQTSPTGAGHSSFRPHSAASSSSPELNGQQLYTAAFNPPPALSRTSFEHRSPYVATSTSPQVKDGRNLIGGENKPCYSPASSRETSASHSVSSATLKEESNHLVKDSTDGPRKVISELEDVNLTPPASPEKKIEKKMEGKSRWSALILVQR